MISNPKHGWCDFNLGNFYGHPSYLTDVPIEILEAFLDWWKHGYGCCWFDEEGSDFTLVFTPYSIYIIEEKDSVSLKIFSDISSISRKELSNEIISDIESCLHEWCVEFTICDLSNKELHDRENLIRNLINELRQYVNDNKCL